MTPMAKYRQGEIMASIQLHAVACAHGIIKAHWWHDTNTSAAMYVMHSRRSSSSSLGKILQSKLSRCV
jgi:hypothetical protein